MTIVVFRFSSTYSTRNNFFLTGFILFSFVFSVCFHLSELLIRTKAKALSSVLESFLSKHAEEPQLNYSTIKIPYSCLCACIHIFIHVCISCLTFYYLIGARQEHRCPDYFYINLNHAAVISGREPSLAKCLYNS